MPYKRGGKKRVKKPVSKADQVFNIAAKALSTAVAVKRLLNVEFKCKDLHDGGLTFSQTGTIHQISNIGQGDTENTRDGSSIKIKSLEINLCYKMHSSVTFGTVCRTILVLDTQTNSAIYVPGDVIDDITAGDSLVSSRNLNNRNRFVILKDWITHLVPDKPYAHKSIYKKMNLGLTFDGTAGSIADLPSNSLSLLVFTNEATNTPTAALHSRIRFIDN
jgi:hypothetical protein